MVDEESLRSIIREAYFFSTPGLTLGRNADRLVDAIIDKLQKTPDVRVVPDSGEVTLKVDQ